MGGGRRSGIHCTRVGLSTVATFGIGLSVDALTPSSAGASSRHFLSTASTSPGSEGVLLALGVGVLVLGGIGFLVFTLTRRKRRPNQCDEQREALELAERSVRYWEAARAHLEAAENEQRLVEGTSGNEPAHASLVANAVDGLSSAIKQRDQCQMELIRCMASGGGPAPVLSPTLPDAQPYFTPPTDGTTPSG
jgi:hypothetical protein